MVKKRVSPRHPWALQMAPQGAATPRLGTTALIHATLYIQRV